MLVKLLIGLLIIACLAPLFLKGPDDKRVMMLDELKPDVSDTFDSLLDKLAPGQAGPAESERRTSFTNGRMKPASGIFRASGRKTLRQKNWC